jgi:NAD(P)-dependent dehydrogenase (short-subunit alcohol dehydrogenase family)
MSKIWFITGASSGFGSDLAKAVIERGDQVAATFRKTEQANIFSKQNKGKGIGLVMDVTNIDQVRNAVKQAIDTYGTIDVLVNNAGYGTIGAIEEFSMEEIRAQMETNFFGALTVTREVLPLMRAKKAGHIVQISSQSGFRAAPGFGLYNASKFALEGFSEALAQEVTPFNIKVVIVEPGPFRTNFLGSSMKPAQRRIDDYKQTPVAQTYNYMENVNGKQEGDPVKAAKAIIDYVYNNNQALRLPLGKLAVQGIRAKLEAVKKDLEANESIAVSAVYE